MNVKKLYLWEQDRYLKFARQVFDDNNAIEYVNNILFDKKETIPAYCFYYEQDGTIISSLIVTISRQNVYGHFYDVPRFHLTGTLPEYRNHGYMDTLIHSCLENLKKESLFLCYLSGLPHFYRQFGFSYGIPSTDQSSFLIKKEDLSAFPVTTRLIKADSFTDSQLVEMIALYEKEALMHFGSVRRTVESLRDKLSAQKESLDVYLLVNEKSSRLQGYCLIKQSEDAPHVIEVIGNESKDYESLLAGLIGVVSSDVLSFTVPLDSITATLLNVKNPLLPEHLRNDSCSLYRILNYESAVSVMLPTLYLRLLHSPFAKHNGCYNLHIGDHGAVSIQIKNGVIGLSCKQGEDLFLTEEQFVELYTGFASFESLLNNITCHNEETKQLLSILFPGGSPYIYPLDL